MKPLKAILISAALFLQFVSCKDTGTGPNQKPFKDPREMKWTADTLPVPQGAIQMLPEDLLVLSPTDIYLAIWVGHGLIMHYDGKTWKIVKEIGGGIDCLVQGNSNDIWAGGYIGHQNGNQFTQTAYLGNYNGVSWYDNELSVQTEILDMIKDPDGNIWACGRNGVILKYDKTKWIDDTVKILNYSPSYYFLKSIEYYNGKIHLLASIGGTRYAYLTGEIKNWSFVDTMKLNSPSSVIKWGNMGLYKNSNEKLYTYGLQGIWSITNNGWEKIFSFDGEIYNMYGASENYLLGVSGYRGVYFFDGSNWNRIGNLFSVSDPTFEFKNVWTDGYEIFLVGFGTINGIDKTIIWHGE